MDANMQQSPKIKRESKRRIKVEFDRLPLKDRLKAKFVNMNFLMSVVWYIFRLILLVGVCYVVLFPFFTKIAGSIMSPEDFVDVTVRLIPQNPTLDIYKAVLTELPYWEVFRNTLILSLCCAFLQTFICCLIAYGLAKFKFRGNKLVMAAVILTMIVPHQTLQMSMFTNFRYFDIWGILSFLSGGAETPFEGINQLLSQINILNLEEHSVNLLNTFWPMVILSVTGLGFKNGLYIFLLRQFFTGVPDALEESAYIDGSGTLHTFLTIILPLSVPMMITVFLFAFCWQWTDDFYTNLFFTSGSPIKLMPDMVPSDSQIPLSLKTDYAGQSMYYAAIRNTCGICIILPLIILYVFCQKFLVQGIERSGLTAE